MYKKKVAKKRLAYRSGDRFGSLANWATKDDQSAAMNGPSQPPGQCTPEINPGSFFRGLRIGKCVTPLKSYQPISIFPHRNVAMWYSVLRCHPRISYWYRWRRWLFCRGSWSRLPALNRHERSNRGSCLILAPYTSPSGGRGALACCVG